MNQSTGSCGCVDGPEESCPLLPLYLTVPPYTLPLQGLQADDETEVFLGKFTFDVQKSEIQTFHLQVCLSLGMRALRWGNGHWWEGQS